jgi:hypothetical protein
LVCSAGQSPAFEKNGKDTPFSVPAQPAAPKRRQVWNLPLEVRYAAVLTNHSRGGKSSTAGIETAGEGFTEEKSTAGVVRKPRFPNNPRLKTAEYRTFRGVYYGEIPIKKK